MTAFENATLNENGRALQLYLGVEFVHDSAFPLSAGDDVYVHPVGNIGFLVLEETALADAYPIEVTTPPDALQRTPDREMAGSLLDSVKQTVSANSNGDATQTNPDTTDH